MSEKLYQKCTLCRGSRTTKMGGSCMGCQASGFVEIGLTLGQVDRLVEDERRRPGDPPTLPRRGPIPESEAIELARRYGRKVLVIIATEEDSSLYRTTAIAGPGSDDADVHAVEGIKLVSRLIFEKQVGIAGSKGGGLPC